jgi:hypothetical protein
MPARAGHRPEASQVAGDSRPELPDPAAHGLVGHVDTALGHELLSIPVTQREPKIEPDRVLDDGGWELVACIRDWRHPEMVTSWQADRHRSRNNGFETPASWIRSRGSGAASAEWGIILRIRYRAVATIQEAHGADRDVGGDLGATFPSGGKAHFIFAPYAGGAEWIIRFPDE